MLKRIVSQIFSILSRERPNPKIELDYTNPYTLLIAVILSARATDKGVNKATIALFEVIETPEDMVKLGEEGLQKYIKTIGLYRSKGRNIIKMSKMLIERFDSQVPATFEELVQLPGVGRKSANVMLSNVYGQATVAVDTHVFRVSNRLGLCNTKTPHDTEKALLKAIPKKWLPKAHHWLVLHGRYVCKSQRPACQKCSINHFCNFYANVVLYPQRQSL